MTKLREAREFALALPGAEEADHWGNPSFRVGGRIFATLPDSDHMNVMIDPFDVEAAVRVEPDACAELRWGKNVSGVRVDLAQASTELVGDLLEAAWCRKAPRRLSAAREREGRGGDGDHKGTAGW
ncbi:MAG TPA: MmcQ/YjbR family DNA-binding protein [Candidatus Dormibacteraeota bacterium]|nr:MmcQ/YjbR family DNA-binding protein [Candidatus Dormibacteraeota bacterium]